MLSDSCDCHTAVTVNPGWWEREEKRWRGWRLTFDCIICSTFKGVFEVSFMVRTSTDQETFCSTKLCKKKPHKTIQWTSMDLIWTIIKMHYLQIIIGDHLYPSTYFMSQDYVSMSYGLTFDLPHGQITRSLQSETEPYKFVHVVFFMAPCNSKQPLTCYPFIKIGDDCCDNN